MNWTIAAERCRACGDADWYGFPLEDAGAGLTSLQCRACGAFASDVVGPAWPFPAELALRVPAMAPHVLLGEAQAVMAALAGPPRAVES